MKLKNVSCLLLAAALGNAPLFAATVWSNPITGTNISSSTAYTTGQTVDTNVTVSGISRGSGTIAEIATNQYMASGFDSLGLNGNDYFTLTLTANPGYEINFQNFTFSGTVGANGPTGFAFRSSADGFTADIGTVAGTGSTISLTGSAYQHITGSIEFRLYAWGAQNMNRTYSVNDFSFTGTVSSIPEPSLSMLIGSASTFALMRRRVRVA